MLSGDASDSERGLRGTGSIRRCRLSTQCTFSQAHITQGSKAGGRRETWCREPPVKRLFFTTPSWAFFVIMLEVVSSHAFVFVNSQLITSSSNY